jgi:hypothetical protein
MWEKEVTPAEEEKAKVKAAQMGWKSLGSPVVHQEMCEKMGDTPSLGQFHRRNDDKPWDEWEVALVSEENERYTVYTVYICNYA